MMFPALHIHVTPERVRIELEGTGVLVDEEAVLALLYSARSEDAVCVGAGEEALKVPEQIRAAEPPAPDDPTPRPSMVPLEDARWLAADLRADAAPVERLADPWAHHGECVLMRPFAPGAGSPRTRAWLIARLYLSLVAEGSPRRLGFAKRHWLALAAPAHVHLPELPADDAGHDVLVRELQSTFGGPVSLNGAPARRRARPRIPWRDWAESAGNAAVFISAAALAVPVLLSAKLGRPLALVVAGVVCLGIAILAARKRLRDGPNEPETKPPSSRALRAAVGAPPDALPADYEGVAQHRFEVMTENGGASLLALPVGVFLLLFVAGVMAFAPPRRTCGAGQPKRDLSGLSAAAAAITFGAGFFGSLFLGARLAAPRLSLGERGITLRLAGRYSRPLRVPYARIRHASVSVYALRLSFHGGQEVVLYLPAKLSSPVLAIESAIVSRLASKGSYRTIGRG